MKRTEPFSYPDIFRVVQYTLDHKRLIIQALGLAVALAALFGFTTLADRFQAETNFLPWFVDFLGILVFYLLLLVFAGPVTWLILEEIRTGSRPSISTAFARGIRFGFHLAAAPAGIISFILAAGLILVTLTAVGMLPGWGPLFWAATFLPRFGAALALIVGSLTLAAATLILPSIIVDRRAGATRAFGVLAEMMRRNFLVFWGYVFTALFLTAVYFLLFTAVVAGSISLLLLVSTAVLGDEPGRVLLKMPPFFSRLVPFLGGHVSVPPDLPPESWVYPAAGAVWGGSLLVCLIAWLAYPFLYLFNSGVIIYLSLTEREKEGSRSRRRRDPI
ncbi:MAG TPA: hypothetical protein PLI51_10385 [bacterium]|nr:hypothetical protein [bacterium]HPQ67122.1 hypothetical protein [bacterium]